jgi:hypothetical protein
MPRAFQKTHNPLSNETQIWTFKMRPRSRFTTHTLNQPNMSRAFQKSHNPLSIEIKIWTFKMRPRSRPTTHTLIHPKPAAIKDALPYPYSLPRCIFQAHYILNIEPHTLTKTLGGMAEWYSWCTSQILCGMVECKASWMAESQATWMSDS